MDKQQALETIFKCAEQMCVRQDRYAGTRTGQGLFENPNQLAESIGHNLSLLLQGPQDLRWKEEVEGIEFSIRHYISESYIEMQGTVTLEKLSYSHRKMLCRIGIRKEKVLIECHCGLVNSKEEATEEQLKGLVLLLNHPSLLFLQRVIQK